MKLNNIEINFPNLIISDESYIGNDLGFLPGFKASFNKLFKKKVYSIDEIGYCESFDDPLLRYASTFAGKESVYKVIKQAYPSLSLAWKKIEIIRQKPAGIPEVKLGLPNSNFNITMSITHDGEYVWAIALLKKV